MHLAVKTLGALNPVVERNLTVDHCPRSLPVASALYQMAIADEIEDSGLKQIAGWAWDALDLADAGHIAESRAQVVTEMARALEHAAKGTGIAWSARVGNMRPLA